MTPNRSYIPDVWTDLIIVIKWFLLTLTHRNFSSDEEYENRRKGASSDEQADPYPPKR